LVVVLALALEAVLVELEWALGLVLGKVLEWAAMVVALEAPGCRNQHCFDKL